MRSLSCSMALVACLTLFSCGGSSTAPLAGAGEAIGIEVAVTGGAIIGEMTEAGIRVWQGIPFAAPPTGDLRWKAPQPVVPWDGSRDATAPGPACMQIPGPEGGFYSSEIEEMSEDCLTLNVWSAAESTSDSLPVMYWIHGGGLMSGSGSAYGGGVLASKGVVLVTVNYRLGPLGFFAHPELTGESEHGVSGNQGIADQIAGLRWVRDSIAAFGGDPNNVTIFGESAGSLSVSLLQASPLAKGLFHRAIGQSGGSFQPMTYLSAATDYSEPSEEIGAAFAEAMGSGDSSLAVSRGVPAEEVLEAFAAFNIYDRLAIVDGRVIPEQVSEIFARGEQSDVPVMIGSNSDEGTTFLGYLQPAFGSGIAGYEAYLAATLPELGGDARSAWPATNDEEANRSFGDLFADVLFTYPQRAWARGMASVSSPAYLYWFTWEPNVEGGYGAFHAAEIGYVFGDVEVFGAAPTDADREFSDTLSDLWVRFAKRGDPNGQGFPEWPAFTRANGAYMELGRTIQVGTDLRVEQVDLVDRAFVLRRGSAGETPGH